MMHYSLILYYFHFFGRDYKVKKFSIYSNNVVNLDITLFEGGEGGPHLHHTLKNGPNLHYVKVIYAIR